MGVLDYRRLEDKMNRIPFYLLITINILIAAAFFVILMFMVYSNIQYTKDCTANTDYLINPNPWASYELGLTGQETGD